MQIKVCVRVPDQSELRITDLHAHTLDLFRKSVELSRPEAFDRDFLALFFFRSQVEFVVKFDTRQVGCQRGLLVEILCHLRDIDRRHGQRVKFKGLADKFFRIKGILVPKP